MQRGPRVRAPELSKAGGPWFNTDQPLRLADLRGRFVLLDFWTSACANCWHVLDELRPVEASRAEVLTVVGVHSPKFPHEAEPAGVATAIARHGITHPVVSDPDLALWRQYAVRAWPTLVLIDPAGYVVAQVAGEGHVAAVVDLVDRLAPEYELRAADSPAPRLDSEPTALRFPSRAILLPAARTGRDADSLLVADTGHHRLVETTTDGACVLREYPVAELVEPGGLALLPDGPADTDVVVTDTSAHVLRTVRLADGATGTIDLPARLTSTGAATVTGPVPGVLSPLDVAWWPALRRLVVAAAGVHLLLSVDPVGGATEVLAGTTVEGLRDGPATDGWLAQPSGLAVDGDRLWFVDAETSALRHLTVDGQLHTVVGEGLFDFGFVDGPADRARMQHPLGVSLLPDGAVAVLDTFNGAVRRYDPVADTLDTLATGLAEPSGAVLVDGRLVVVESAANRLVPLDLDPVGTAGEGPRRPGARDEPSAERVLRPGRVRVGVELVVPDGRRLDQSGGTAVRLDVRAEPAALLRGAEPTTGFARFVALGDPEPSGDSPGGTGPAGVLTVTARAATCDADPGVAHPACYVDERTWLVPVRFDPAGADDLPLTWRL